MVVRVRKWVGLGRRRWIANDEGRSHVGVATGRWEGRKEKKSKNESQGGIEGNESSSKRNRKVNRE